MGPGRVSRPGPVATRQRMVSLLIVDDSDEIRRMVRTFVSAIADPIYECRDGGAAIDAYAAHRPDWVLMDVSMLPMDGITATRRSSLASPRHES